MKHVVAAEGDVADGAAEAVRVIDVGQRSTYQIHRPEITVTSRTLCLYFSEKYNTSHFNRRMKKKTHFQFTDCELSFYLPLAVTVHHSHSSPLVFRFARTKKGLQAKAEVLWRSSAYIKRQRHQRKFHQKFDLEVRLRYWSMRYESQINFSWIVLNVFKVNCTVKVCTRKSLWATIAVGFWHSQETMHSRLTSGLQTMKVYPCFCLYKSNLT